MGSGPTKEIVRMKGIIKKAKVAAKAMNEAAKKSQPLADSLMGKKVLIIGGHVRVVAGLLNAGDGINVKLDNGDVEDIGNIKSVNPAFPTDLPCGCSSVSNSVVFVDRSGTVQCSGCGEEYIVNRDC